MFAVKHRITIAGTTWAAGDTSRLLDLETFASFRAPINRCTVVLPATDPPKLNIGDPLSVDLGYDKTLERVFTGTIVAADYSLHTLTIEACGAARVLGQLFQNAVYEKRAAGAIASDIVAKGKLAKGTIEDGVTFTSYTLGSNLSLLEQLVALARRCGFDVYANPQDQIMFRAYAAQKTHSFAYGEQLLALEATPRLSPVDGVEVYGSSPAGQGQSEEASSWLTKKDVKGAAGKTAGNVVRIIDATARTQDQAKLLATNLFKTMSSTAAGQVRVLGAAGVALGDAINLSKLPQASANGEFRVTSVRHRLNRRLGFVTEIGWEQR